MPDFGNNARMIIQTTIDVSLRDVIADDLPIYFEQQIDPEAVEMAAHPPRDREAFRVHWAEILAKESMITKAILLDGHVAGPLAEL